MDELEHQMIIFKEFTDLCAVYTNKKQCLHFLHRYIPYEMDNEIEMDKDIINEFINTNENSETDSNSNSIEFNNYTFFSDLNYLTRILVLFNIW